MKKLIAFVMTFAMLLTITIPTGAFAKADQKIKLDDAINTAKTLLDLKTDDYNFNYNYNENPNYQSSWSLSWNSKKGTGGGMSVSVDSETGDILNYYSYTSYNPQITLRIPKYSKNEARDAVVKFLNKVAPDKFKETVEKDNPNSIMYDNMQINSDTYNFNFVREVNGLDFFDNGMSISIDKNTLQIRNYNLNWDKGPFADPAKAIPQDKAKEIFGSKLGIELAYNIITDNNTQTPILVYSLKNGNSSIDALTGEIINNSSFYAGAAMADKAAALSRNSALTPQEQSSVDASSKYVSKDAAITEAKKYLTLSDKYVLNGTNLFVNDTDKSAQWYLNWSYNASKGSYSYASANIDAITGKMTSFNMNGSEFYPDKDTAISYTKDQAKDIAAKFISSLEPDKFKLTEFKDLYPNQVIDQKQSDYNFSYVGKINGATCSFDSFNVTVNPYSGKIMSYSSSWSDVKLPEANGVISLQDAYTALYKTASLNLRYVKYYNYSLGGDAKPEIKLAYTLDGLQGMLDAKTGTQIDYSGKPIVAKQKIQYTDIKGNAAENDINSLVDLGIIDDASTTFNPDAAILQKDFIKMLVKSLPNNYVVFTLAKDGSVDYSSFYDTAIQKNILTESQKNPDARVTRQDAAKFILRAMGLGYVAENTSIFTPSYKDAGIIEKAYKGYAAISGSLNLLPTTNGQFDGGINITRGQSASSIVNYLKVDTTK